MSIAKIYNQYAYIAGIRIPILSTVIGSNFGSLASMNIAINYSPFITRIFEQTKIQVWEQIINNGIVLEPTLEFDGIIIGIQRRRNILGEVSVSLSCLTDGAIWNIRKQADFYLQDIINADYRGTGDVLNIRTNGQITNYFTEILGQNKFDIGCCIASILTSYINGVNQADKNEKPDTTISSYQYRFNGKIFQRTLIPDAIKTNINPIYYNNYLDDYRLASKVYGISTSKSIKSYFKLDSFINLITNTQNDVYGENTFWQLAISVAQYGFFNIYDIPNPTYVNTDNSSKIINVVDMLPSDTKDSDTVDPKPDNITLLKENGYKGLAEYIFKPISIMGIPFECNVIWPDQIIEESIFYDFFNTPTRILYQRSPIPGLEKNILTTSMLVGPNFDATGYLGSMTINTGDISLRDPNEYSEYEQEYGIKYDKLKLSIAFDNALLKDLDNSSLSNPKTQAAFKNINKYLNYEYAQKFLGTRQYSIQVTPDCNPVAGFPVVVLNKMGEHVIAFCTGTRKSWSAQGQKSVSMSVAYPRYYFEDLGDLGNVIDTISQDQMSLDEISKLIGSKPIGKLNASIKDFATVKNTIINLFDKFQNFPKDAVEIMKDSFRRSVCTYEQFMDLHDTVINKDLVKTMPKEYPIDKFDSSNAADNLTSHYFEVYDSMNKEVVPYEGKSCSEIINLHLEWIKNPKRI